MERARTFLSLPFVLLILLISSGISIAASDTKSLIIKANVGKIAKLIVKTKTITFPNMDPDARKQVPALENEIKLTVKTRTGSTSPVTLNIVADGDIVSGPDTISIQNVTWQASGHGFLSGTLSKTTGQPAGFWTGSGIREGIFRYYLNNSWNYATGVYQATVTYSLVTP